MIGIGEILGYNILLYICLLNIDVELLFLNIIKKYVYENVYILIELKFMFLK